MWTVLVIFKVRDIIAFMPFFFEKIKMKKTGHLIKNGSPMSKKHGWITVNASVSLRVSYSLVKHHKITPIILQIGCLFFFFFANRGFLCLPSPGKFTLEFHFILPKCFSHLISTVEAIGGGVAIAEPRHISSSVAQ